MLAFTRCTADRCNKFLIAAKRTHWPSYLLGYCRGLCNLVWTNSASIGIDGAVSSDVIGYFQAITCFGRALSLDTVGYKQALWWKIVSTSCSKRVSCICSKKRGQKPLTLTPVHKKRLYIYLFLLTLSQRQQRCEYRLGDEKWNATTNNQFDRSIDWPSIKHPTQASASSKSEPSSSSSPTPSSSPCPASSPHSLSGQVPIDVSLCNCLDGEVVECGGIQWVLDHLSGPQHRGCHFLGSGFFGFWVLGIILNFPEPLFWRANFPEPSQISQNPKKPACLRKLRAQHDVVVLCRLRIQRSTRLRTSCCVARALRGSCRWQTTIGAIEFRIKNNQFIWFF
jgi:hypothetical protein